MREFLHAPLDELAVMKTKMAFKSTILQVFEQNTDAIFMVVGGPKSADWVRQKEECIQKIEELSDKLHELYCERARIAALIDQEANYETSIKIQLGRRQEAVEEAKRISSDLQRRIETSDNLIDAIPKIVTQDVTTSHSGWWFWRRRVETTTHHQVANPNRDSEVAYLKSLIQHRIASKRDNENKQKAEEEAEKALNQEIARCQAERKGLGDELTSYTTQEGPKFKRISTLLGEIQEQQEQIKKIEKDADRMETTFGLRGSVLVNCLIAARSLTRRAQGQTIMLAPLISMIGSIQAAVKPNVAMLQNPRATPHDMHTGAQGLLSQMGALIPICKNLNDSANFYQSQHLKVANQIAEKAHIAPVSSSSSRLLTHG